MNLMAASEYKAWRDEIVHLEKNDVHLFLDPESPNWISTNPVGAEAMKYLGSMDIEQAAQAISHRWNEDTEVVRRDLAGFLKELNAADFPGRKSEKKYPGRSEVVECGQLQELWIYTNNSCNLRCHHCFVSAGDTIKEEMTSGEIKALIDEARELGAFRFYFTGGEPFLRKDIFELIEYVLSTPKNELVILSNGTLFNRSTLKRLKAFRKKNLVIQVSLEGPDAAVNDFVRGKGSFERAVQGIKNLVGIGISPIVTTTLTKHNAGHLTEMPGLLRSLGVNNYHILLLQNRGRAKVSSDEIALPPVEVTPVMQELIKRARESGIVLDNEMSLKVRARAKRGRKYDLCNSCYEMLSIDSDGQVYPCAPLNGEKRFNCGSIHDSSLKDIWQSSKTAQEIRNTSVASKEGCNRCSIRFICGGGCFCQSYFSKKAAGGSGITAKDPYCHTLHSLIFDLIWELAVPPDLRIDSGVYQPPSVFSSMESYLPSCAVPSTLVRDFSFEAGTFHCSCVLGVELEGDMRLMGSGEDRLTRDACFNELAHEYEEWMASPIGTAYGDLAKKTVIPLIPLNRGMSVLDVGCGTGNYGLELAKKGAHVVGLDSSEWMLRICQAKGRRDEIEIKLKHAFGEKLPYPDETFDAVVSINYLEFSSDPEKAVSEMLRVLKKDGHLILGVLNKKSLWGFTQQIKKTFVKGAYYEARFFTPKELAGLFNGSGVRLSLLSTIYFPPVNHKGMMRFNGLFEKIGRKIFSRSGALVVASAIKR